MSNLAQPTILVIDTDSASAATTSAVLSASDHLVYCAHSQGEALEISARIELDLVICDLNLAGVSGYETIAAIRALPQRSDVPVMFATEAQTPDVIRKFHGAAAAFHLKKPVSAQVLLELVDRALWMPHLVQNHLEQHSQVRKPHFPVPTSLLQSPSFDASIPSNK